MGADATENGEGSSKSSKRGKASAGKQDTPQKDKLTSWEPPRGTWEDDVNNVDAVEEQADATTGEKIRQAFIMWNDGRKTMHPLHVINQKCPQKVGSRLCM